MGKIVKMSFEGQNLQYIGKWTEVLCFQKEIDSKGCSDPALGLYYTIIDFNEVYIRIYLPDKNYIHRGRQAEVNIIFEGR